MWPVRVPSVTLSVLFQISCSFPRSLQANGGLRFPFFALLRSRYCWIFTDVSGQPVCQILERRNFFSYYRQTLHENTKVRRPRLHHGGSLVSCNAGIFARVTPRPVPSTSFRIGLVVRASDYWSRGPGFDSRLYHGNFPCGGRIPVVTMVWVVSRFRLKVETSSTRSQTSINSDWTHERSPRWRWPHHVRESTS